MSRIQERHLGQRELLVEAIRAGDADRVRALLADGAAPHEIEEAGDVTPLMYAAIAGSIEVVEAPVAAGADVDTVAEDLSGDLDQFTFLEPLAQQGKVRGMTALAYAILYGNVEVGEFLAPRTDPPLRREAELLRRAREAFDHFGSRP